MIDAKDVRYKSPINRAIAVIVVIMVNTKQLGKIERILKGVTKERNMINVKFPTKKTQNRNRCVYFFKVQSTNIY